VASSDPTVVQGAQLFHQKGCEYCHRIAIYGGRRGPDLTDVGSRLTRDQLIWRILNGGTNMPSFAHSLTPDQVNLLVAFLGSRVTPSRQPVEHRGRP
jgi:ubiquinol-cytochrome c reductase cytochrome b subunit